jgi:predicted dienelactone hydrolase
MTMRILRKLFLLLFLIPGLLHATEEVVVLEDGSSVKVFLFYPENDGEGPWPLTVLMSGGTANEYIVRAQFWLGDELASRGLVIAAPMSPASSRITPSSANSIICRSSSASARMISCTGTASCPSCRNS